MTFGQRIAQKRKELGLSQEGLGERLGVSRQAIYKWESDTSLPEIDKLITLSQLFSVSVGWLLGVEEAGPEPASPDREKWVEDILSRYQAAQPEPQKSVWDKWSVRILFALCGIMLALLVGVNHKIKEMDRDYSRLAGTVASMDASLASEIDAILDQYAEAASELVLNGSTEVASTDPGSNTVTFDMRLTPKVYTEGMGVRFVARSGADTVEVTARLEAGLVFRGQLTCPLTDEIALSAVVLADGKQTLRPLETYTHLYTESFPEPPSGSCKFFPDSVSGSNVLPAYCAGIQLADPDIQPVEPASLQVGLFQDRKLLVWYEYGTQTRWGYLKTEKETGWWLPQNVTLDPGCEYHQIMLYTDEYGRRCIFSDAGLAYNETEGLWQSAAPYADGLNDWAFGEA